MPQKTTIYMTLLAGVIGLGAPSQVGSATQAAAQKPAPPKVQTIQPPPDVKAPPSDAIKTPSGLSSKVLQKGTGDKPPGAQDVVTVHYTGWTTDGKMFDSSQTGGTPATFPVNGVIRGWTEALQLMVVGEKRRVWIPEALAYQGKRDPKGMLVFDIELLEVVSLAAPPDVANAPADAKRTPSGLAYKVLRPGKGTARPNARSQVTVHYTGWTTDGKAFDSSYRQGKPITFGLNEVIPGWTEGVQLMVEGERARFWIPQRLAYDGAANAPRGMLVFDIELISFRR